MNAVDQNLLLAVNGTIQHESMRRSSSNATRSKKAQARLSLYPSLSGLRNRFSQILNPAELLRGRAGSSSNGDPLSAAAGQDESSDPYWRPLPYNLDDSEKREIHCVKNAEDKLDIVSGTEVIYQTNLPPLSKASKSSMPEQIILTACRRGTSQARLSSNALIQKINGQLTVHLQGLDPITFYRAKPSCFRPVDCFTIKRTANKSAWRATSTCFAGQAVSADLVSIEYAWKHTSSEGKGGLKLVDLRDSEVLAYFVPSHGKTFGKITLQGSGLTSQRLVLSTILALRYRNVLPDRASSSPSQGLVNVASIASASWSETSTACDRAVMTNIPDHAQQVTRI